MLRALSSYSAHESMPVDDIIARFPTLRQEHAHPATSTKYQHISTAETLRHMERNGFAIHGVDIQGAREGRGREGYQKHMIRLRVPGLPEIAPGTVPEICFRNAHDGCGAYALFAGAFRFFCWNGIVAGSIWGAFKVPHVGQDIAGRVLSASTKIVDSFGMLRDVVTDWQGIELSPIDQLTFANQALQLRYDTDAETGVIQSPVTPAAVNSARRDVDRGNSLWLTYNRTQENLIAGGIYGRTLGTGRKVKLRGLKAIDENVRINRALFSLAESFAANKASPNVAELAAFGPVIEGSTV